MSATDRPMPSDARPHRPPRRWPVRLAIGLAGLLALYALAGFLLVPWLAQRQLPPRVGERLGLELTLGTLRFNPFTLRAEAHDIALVWPDGEPLLTATRAAADLDWVGLFTRRWTLAALELDAPKLELLRETDGSFALPQPAEPASTEPPEEAGSRPPPALRLRQLAVRDGTVSVRSRDGSAEPVTLEGIALEASDLANSADETPGSYHLSARLPGSGTLKLAGRLAGGARSSEGSAAIADAELAGWWPLLARDWALAPPQGRLSASGDFRAAAGPEGFDLLVEQLALAAEGLHVARPGSDAPMLALRRAASEGGRFALRQRQLTLPGLHLAEGELSLQVDAQGRLDWATLRREREPTPEGEGGPWQIELPEARVEALALHYLEQGNERRRLDAGRSDATGTLRISTGESGVRLENLHATLQAPRFSGADATPLALERIDIQEGSLDTARRALGAGTLTLSGSRADVSIAPDDTLELPGGLLPRAADEGRTADAPADEADEPWSYAIRQLNADDIDFGLHDRRAATPLQLRGRLGLQLSNVASGSEMPLGVDARLDIAGGGRLRLQGEAAQDAGTLQGRLLLDAVDLSPARALVEYHTTLRLADGRIGGELEVHYARDGKPQLQTEGKARLDDIRFDVADSGEPLFSARSVTAQGALQLAPGRLALSSVVLDRPVAQLRVDRDRKLNLAEILRERREEGAGAREARQQDESERFALRIERIELREATIDFSDQSLILPFSTQVTRLNGTLNGVDNADRAEAVIDARGAIEPHGEARVEGRLRPFATDELTDVTVSFDNVEMSSLSPYTATFAGRKIARGRLWLSVDYRVFDQRLDGRNTVTLEEFELGERVDAPGAMDLPLELALALLRDPEGRVHLEVPVRGNVGDAHFAYGALVRDAVGNVLRRMVTAPFRLLASLVGGGAEDDSLQAIGFEAGSDRIAAPQQEKLQRLADAVKQRPQLRLQLRGTYHAGADDEALRLQALRREIAGSAGATLGPDPLGQLDFGNSAIRRAVATEYEALTGPNALAEFRSQFGRGPEAGNETALHRAMFERLLQNQPLAEGELDKLAERRGEVVRDFLAGQGVDAARLENQPAGQATSDKGAGVELTAQTR